MSKLTRYALLVIVVALAVLLPASYATAGSALAGKSIGLSPGHGLEWSGSGWVWERPQTCAPLTQEDLHTVEICAYLNAYLLEDGAVVKSYRCLDKNYGNCPLTGVPWWQMSASYWLQQQGYPASVYASSTGDPVLGSGANEYQDTVDSRALASNYDNTDILLGLHTNAFDGTITGTETYYDSSATIHQPWWAASQSLATVIDSNVVNTIRTYYDGSWNDRGPKNANGAYHETQIANRPTALLELAFHDNCSKDALYLQDNFFRSTTMWAMYKAVCNYFGTTPTYDYYSCDLVSSDIPDKVIAGQTVPVHITYCDRGVLWNAARGFELKALGTSDPFTTQLTQTVANDVGPGENVTFTFNLTAPTVLGPYQTGWMMAREGIASFGPSVQKVVQVIDASADTNPPTVPTALAATPVSFSRISLSWTASTDDTGVMGYKIYRNGAFVGSTTGNYYTDINLQPSTSYSYQVSAYDGAGNESAKSDAASATTLGDGTPPEAPTGVVATGASLSRMTLTWNVPWDNTATTSYKVFRNGTQVGTSTTASYNDSGLAAGTSYTYRVSALDAAGNESSQSAPSIGRTVGYGTQAVFLDNFESYTSQASFAAAWPGAPGGYSPANWSTAQSYSPTHAAEGTIGALVSIHDITSVPIAVGNFFEFKFYDPLGAASAHQWATVRNYSSGGHAGTLSEMLDAGCHYNQAGITTSKYNGRSAYAVTTNAGWFDISAPRAPGWHTMRVDVTADTTNTIAPGKGLGAWSVDGVVGADNVPIKWLAWTAVTCASGNASAADSGSYYYDDIKVGVQGGVQRLTGPNASEAPAGTVTIAWATDLSSTSRVDYGPTSSYGLTATDGTLTKSHSITLTGLAPASVYHFMVTSTAAGKTDSVSEDFIFTTSASSLSALRGMPTTTTSGATGLVVSAVLVNGFYVQDVNRVCGIKVLGSTNAHVGSLVNVSGTLDTDGGERVLRNAIVVPAGSGDAPAPLALSTKSAGGAAISADLPGVTNGKGANNIGLLVKTSGKVIEAGTNAFWVDDGCHLIAADGKTGLKVNADGLVMPEVGDLITVIGISGAESISGSIWPVLRPRTDADVLKLGHF